MLGGRQQIVASLKLFAHEKRLGIKAPSKLDILLHRLSWDNFPAV